MKITNKERLAEIAKAAQAKYKIPGMSAAIIENGVITAEYLGGVMDDKGTPVTENTLFEAASLTKSMFAAFFLRLVDKGMVSLDEPVIAQGGPVWSDDPRCVKITPRQCLSHGTGLPNWSKKPMPIRFDPGTSFSYSGEGYYLLQHLIETKLGRSWPELMDEGFFIPWNMPAGVVWTPELAPRISWGYDEDIKLRKIRDSLDTDDVTGEPNAAWSLYSNARLYAEFVCHMMDDRCGLSDASFAEMRKAQNHAAKGVDWGLGWGLSDGLLWHWGDNGGFKNFVIWDPETKNGVTVFTNTDIGMCAYFDMLCSLTDATCCEDIRKFIMEAE